MEDELNYFQMEDSLNILVNGRQPQYSCKWETFLLMKATHCIQTKGESIKVRRRKTFSMQKISFYENDYNLAKLGDGLDESPTVMVGDNKNKNSNYDYS
jgi:hypothetical protein